MKRCRLKRTYLVVNKDRSCLESYRNGLIPKNDCMNQINQNNKCNIDEEYFDYLVRSCGFTPKAEYKGGLK